MGEVLSSVALCSMGMQKDRSNLFSIKVAKKYEKLFREIGK